MDVSKRDETAYYKTWAGVTKRPYKGLRARSMDKRESGEVAADRK